MNKETIYLLIFSFLLPLAGISQLGGRYTYSFLDLTSSPRIAATGGDFLAVKDNDIQLTPTNPSLITGDMHNNLGLSFVDYYSDINYGFASYGRSFGNVGNFVASMIYIDYGKFDFAEVTGERTGSFYAGESALSIGWGRELDSSFSIGSNLKMIYSSFESYSSFGLAIDIAGSYHDNERNLTLSFIAKNIGRPLKSYVSGNTEPLPFEMQFGLSKRLKHLPFRYIINYNHIEKWDLTYDDPDDIQVDAITGEVVEKNKFEEIADNFMRHITIGGELLISKNLFVRAGYNYKRRQELKVKSKLSTVGFSWGIGIRVSKFHISYARSAYHLAGSPNYISITTNLSKFMKSAN
ncbi:MAG: type IX secretion system protein PorQ [Bacteroidales bacterium]|nr:type IX secretion system protein PorQ [Bacteroidales bacterium]